MRKRMSPKMRAAQEQYSSAKKSPLGSGKRFSAMEHMMEAEGMHNPGGAAASIGRKRYGKKRFQEMAAAGRRRAH